MSQLYHTPIYSLRNVAHYVRISPVTLRGWVYSNLHNQQPLIQRPDSKIPRLSFTNLIEAYLLTATNLIPTPKVRSALTVLQEHFKDDHPLVLAEFPKTGVALFLEHLVTTRSSSLALKHQIDKLLRRVIYDDFQITKFLPTKNTILIDPAVSFGKPTVAAVPTKIIKERYDAGDSIAVLAEDYGLKPADIKKAIVFEAYYYV